MIGYIFTELDSSDERSIFRGSGGDYRPIAAGIDGYV